MALFIYQIYSVPRIARGMTTTLPLVTSITPQPTMFFANNIRFTLSTPLGEIPESHYSATILIIVERQNFVARALDFDLGGTSARKHRHSIPTRRTPMAHCLEVALSISHMAPMELGGTCRSPV